MAVSPAPLPSPLTSFVGREHELGEFARLLQQVRLVTLAGPGGCGKTRLALALAARCRSAFADGVAFVDLASLASPGLVAPTVVRALGLREQADCPPLDVLTTAVRNLRLLLVLDNVEHLLEGCAPLAAGLLRACPLLTLLATSRERLGVAGEQLFALEPLPVPAPAATPGETEAERLFVDRARLRLRQFAPTPRQAQAIAEICRRLDGLPLAVELAAARVTVLSVEQIAARLADRFRLLVGGDRGTPARQRTLQATLDWSYGLLTQAERAALLRVSVFAGSFTLAAAEAVCAEGSAPHAAVLDLLARLVDQSLLQVDVSGAEARYRLLETVRLYGRERLRAAGEVQQTLARHAEYALSLAETGAAHALGHERFAWLDRLEQQIDDLRQAMQWLLDTQATERALRLAAALLQLCWVRGYMSEGRRWLRAALTQAGDGMPRSRATALRAEGQLAYAQGDFAAAHAALQESAALYEELGDEAGLHAPLLMLGAVAWEQGRFDESRAAYDRILASARRRQDEVRTAEALVHVGLAALGQGNCDEARAAIGEALSIYEALALHQQAFVGVGNLGAVAHAEGKLEEAQQHCEASLHGLEQVGFPLAEAAQLDRLAEVARRQGRLVDAREQIRRSLRLRAELAARAGFAEGLATAGMIAATEGDAERSALLLGAAEARRRQMGMALLCFYQDEHARVIEQVRAALGAARLAERWARGAILSQEALLALVEGGGEIAQGAAGSPSPVAAGATPSPARAAAVGEAAVLSERERAVLRLVSAGRSNKEIARKLSLSVRTVEHYLQTVYGKLGVPGRAAAAVAAIRLGLVPAASEDD